MSEINKNIIWKDIVLMIGGEIVAGVNQIEIREPEPLTKEDLMRLKMQGEDCAHVEYTPIKYRKNKKYKGKNHLLKHLNKFI